MFTRLLPRYSNLLSSIPVMLQYKVTATATALPTHPLNTGIILTALSGNAGSIFIGLNASVTTTADGTGAGYILAAGNSISIAIQDTKYLFIIGTANDVLTGIGS
jgi:hypothetical protein